MPHDLIPELHDVLKLTVLKHNFVDFGPFQTDSPNTPTWRGVLQHHCSERFPAYPTDRDTFLLHMADGLAANFSRHQQDIQHDTAWTVYPLWDPKSVGEDQRLTKPDDIRAMLGFLGTDPTFEEFYARYKRIFETRAEDARPGMNITTLATHLRLAGRFYRFLRGSKVLQITEDEVREAARDAKSVGDLRKRKEQEWQIHLIRCRPRVLANPFRARDMNSFACLEEFLQAASQLFAENLLFVSTQELLLCADDPKILDDLRALAAPRSIALEIVRKREQIRDANLEFDVGKAQKRRKRINPEFESLYPPLEAQVTPPICEICQLQRATKVWPDDYLAASQLETGEVPQGRDFLCETCFAIRSRPSKLKKLAHWEEWAEGDLIWARFGLDFDRLQETLRALYLRYLRSLDANTPDEKAEVRFSLVAEFQKDYEKCLAHVRDLLLKDFGGGRTELVLPDLLCIQAESGSDVFVVLRCFQRAVETFFPAFLGECGCPLKLSLTFCGVKQPFFEAWQQWQEQQSELEVTAVGRGRLELEIRHLQRFLQLADFHFRRSALHNLAEISRISQQLAELRFRAAAEKGERETFQHLKEFLPLGLTFDGILTLAKLVGG